MARNDFLEILDDLEHIFKHPDFLGFAPLVNELRGAAHQNSNYPPRNIIKIGEESWILEVALAGFAPYDIDVEEHDGYLKVRGHSNLVERAGQEYLHQGMARRDFDFGIKLGEHVKVNREYPPIMQNGVLVVQFIRVVPDAQKSTKWKPIDPTQKVYETPTVAD
jgi:molecular chaperone IbpA